jgi:4-hydroxy-tetrahydrodipicolinate synthase
MSLLLPEGLIPCSYSPFTNDYRLDEKVLHERLESVVKGSSGLHGPANHSEMALLTFDEWKVWVDVMVDVAKKAKIKTWAFFGTESFEKTIPYGEYALKAGADGFILHPPYKVKYSQEAAYLYYRDFAKEFPTTPIWFYPNFATENPTDPYLAAKIAEIPNIVGMKLTRIFNIEQAAEVFSLTRNIDHFRLVTGSLINMYALRGLGIKSSLSAQSNYVHEWSLQLWQALQAGDWKTADIWYKKIAKLHRALNHPGGHLHAYAGEKAAMALLGKPVGPPRRPCLPASEQQVAFIRKTLEEVGLIKPK